jgi:membrane-bound inhibitor of C-type lysozyme
MKAYQLNALILPIAVALAAIPSHADQISVSKYLCEDGNTLEVQLRSDDPRLNYEARVKYKTFEPITLLPVDSTEGLKFANGYTLLKINGNQASLEYRYRTIFAQCVAQ